MVKDGLTHRSQQGKYFQMGDYVTVMSGEHAGDAGYIEQACKAKT